MKLELDHVFILVEPGAEVADLLLELGIKESFSREHPGQGTSNRRFEFSNGMLEFLFVRNSKEAQNGPGKDLLFTERTENKKASPFGIILTRKDNSDLDMPFSGWSYQPDYFPSPMAFHVGTNSEKLNEPLCFYIPFIEPQERNIKKGKFKSISHVKIYTTADQLSDVLAVADNADRLSIECGNEHLMEITFDEKKLGLSKDFRPYLPLIVHW